MTAGTEACEALTAVSSRSPERRRENTGMYFVHLIYEERKNLEVNIKSV